MNININKLEQLIASIIVRDLFNSDEEYRNDAKTVAADVLKALLDGEAK